MIDTAWPDFDDVIDPDDVPVPGSRPRVQHPPKPPVEAKPHRPWQDEPTRVYRVDGVDMPLYRIGALAKALGRRPYVVKEWERKGWLPKTSLRMAHPENRSRIKNPKVNGLPNSGRRLYTKEFIAGIEALAKETGVDVLSVYVGDTDFPQRARDLYYETMPGEPE